MIVEDVDAEETYVPHRGVAAAAGYRAIQSTPLFGKDGALLGLLTTYFRQPHCPSERELRLTDLYASQAGEMIERNRTREVLAYQANLLAMATDPIVAFDAEGRITYWNPGAERVYGWSIDEAAGRTFADLQHPLHGPVSDETRGAVRDPMHAGHVVQGEFLGQRKDGSSVSIEHSSRALFDREGQVSGYISVHRDISERKQLDQDLLALRNELSADLAAMQRLHELSLRLISASELTTLLDEILAAAMELQGAEFGLIQLLDPRTDALGITAQRGFDQRILSDPTHLDSSHSARLRAVRQRARVTIEDVADEPGYAPLRPTAEEAGYRALDATPLVGQGGEVLGVLATYFRRPHRPSERELRLTDLYARLAGEMIERSRTEAALAYQANLLAMATDAIIASDANSRITYWNPGAERVYGWSAKEALGKSPDDLFPPVEDAGWEREQLDVRLYEMRGGGTGSGGVSTPA